MTDAPGFVNSCYVGHCPYLGHIGLVRELRDSYVTYEEVE